MPTFKKPRKKGVTYKLVPRSYGDADGEDGPIWVSEAEFYRHHQTPTAVEEENKAQQQFRMYAAAANAEFKEEHHHRSHAEGAEGEGPEEGEYYDEEDGEYYCGDEEGEWVDGDWEEEEGEAEAVAAPPKAVAAAPSCAASRPAATAEAQKAKTVSFALPGPTASTAAASPRPHASNPTDARRVSNDDDNDENERADSEADAADEDEQLFEDEVECEVTDDFLRQLVFGNGDEADDGAGENDDFMMDDDEDDWDGLDHEDGEMWRLLTDEEKAAIKASRRRGTARRRKMAFSEAEAATRTHAADGTEYPTHDVTQRAVDRQFTEMMREFNADARLNDACTDDPRTHGALPMEKYMAALEEFVTDRAGMDVETAEPHKNKGLIQQLKYLSHHAGAFDSDARGTYMTTLLPEKQQRFVAEFQKGTEEIRRAARMRLAQRHQAAVAATPSAAVGASAVPVSMCEEPVETKAEEEEMIVLEVKSKADRLDCETAVSAYSTYYNQPNVIQAPRTSKPARHGMKKSVGTVKGNVISASGTAAESKDATGKGTTPSLHNNTLAASKEVSGQKNRLGASSDDDEDNYHSSGSDNGEVLATNQMRTLNVIPTVRPKDETKEEKKLRRQAVKAAQRERRQAKSALKSTYKQVESEEVKRSATSQAARRTVHFM